MRLIFQLFGNLILKMNFDYAFYVNGNDIVILLLSMTVFDRMNE